MKKLLTFLLVLNCVYSPAQIDFLTVQSYEIGSEVTSVALGDVNNDGLEDAIVATEYDFDPFNDSRIFVFLQNQDGTLASPVKYQYTEDYVNRAVIQVEDVNNDNLNDVIIGFEDSIGIFFQNNSGTLNSIVTYYSGTDVDGIQTGDLNNDNLPDIAVCHWNDDFIKVFYQPYDNGFTEQSYTVASGGWDEIDIGDVNNDELNDLVFMPGQSSSGTLIIFYQDSLTGINTTPTIFDYEIGYHTRFNGIDIGDLNNDGRTDVVGTIGGNEAWIALIFQDENGNLGEAEYIDSYDIPTPVEIEDLNCDGKNEIIVGHKAWSHFSVFEQDSSGNYNEYLLFGSLYYVNPYGMVIGDYNNDARPDVLTTNGFSEAYFIYNSSAPDSLISADTSVVYDYYYADTTDTWDYTYIDDDIDTLNECLIQTTNEYTVTVNSVYYEILGDSIIARTFEMCGNFIEDTITIEIEVYSSQYLYDTTAIIISIDTLIENYTYVGDYMTNDTSGISTSNFNEIVVFEDIDIINDTVYIVTDSLNVYSYFLLIDLLEGQYEIYEGTKCGELVSDTLLIWTYLTTDTILLARDTTLISHTEVSYPLGIDQLFWSDRKIKIYPNPVSDRLFIETDFKFSTEIYSLMGELIIRSVKSEIDLNGLQSSSYIVVIKDLKGIIRARQLILKK